MHVRAPAISHSFWVWAAVAVLTSLANSVSADPMDTITVQAQRDKAKLEREVNKFVSSTIVQPRNYDESLWRWKDNVCPLVAGLIRSRASLSSLVYPRLPKPQVLRSVPRHARRTST